MPNDQYQEILIVIVTSVLVLGLLIGTLVVLMLNYQKKRFLHLEEKRNLQATYERNLLLSRLEIQEETFDHISREIHDNVGQLLSLAKVQLNIALQNSQSELLNEIKNNVGQAMTDLRDIAKSLNATRLQQIPISEAFSHELQRICRSGIFECEFITNGKSDLTNRLSEQNKIILFRMVQEGLQNIIKHAKATRVLLIMESKENEVVVKLTDNGDGFDAGIVENQGLGLENIKKRARMAGGEAVIFSRIGEGTSIAIQIPYE